MTLQPNWVLMKTPLNYATVFLMVLLFVFSIMVIQKVSA